MIYCRILVAGAVCLMLTSSASAKDTDEQQKLARTACLAGDYAKGAAILSELFVATHDPVHIYNQGRCFEQNHRYEDAIARFQEYLRVARKLSKADRTDAERHIASCQELLAKQSPSRPTPGGSAKEAKEKAAKKACLNGDPTKGVEILTDLYVDTNDPIYIFNQGRCYEQSNLCDEAIVRFREYLRKTPDGSERDRADVAKHIADCEALVAKNPGRSAPPSTPVVSSDVPKPIALDRSPGAVSASASGPEAAVASKAEDTSGRGLRLAGALTMSAGGAFLIAGVALNLKHNGMVRDLQADYSGGTADTAQTYKTLSTAGYIAGAACVLGGGLLYVLGRRAGEAAVVPDLADNRAGLLWVGHF